MNQPPPTQTFLTNVKNCPSFHKHQSPEVQKEDADVFTRELDALAQQKDTLKARHLAEVLWCALCVNMWNNSDVFDSIYSHGIFGHHPFVETLQWITPEQKAALNAHLKASPQGAWFWFLLLLLSRTQDFARFDKDGKPRPEPPRTKLHLIHRADITREGAIFQLGQFLHKVFPRVVVGLSECNRVFLCKKGERTEAILRLSWLECARDVYTLCAIAPHAPNSSKLQTAKTDPWTRKRNLQVHHSPNMHHTGFEDGGGVGTFPFINEVFRALHQHGLLWDLQARLNLNPTSLKEQATRRVLEINPRTTSPRETLDLLEALWTH